METEQQRKWFLVIHGPNEQQGKLEKYSCEYGCRFLLSPAACINDTCIYITPSRGNQRQVTERRAAKKRGHPRKKQAQCSTFAPRKDGEGRGEAAKNTKNNDNVTERSNCKEKQALYKNCLDKNIAGQSPQNPKPLRLQEFDLPPPFPTFTSPGFLRALPS